MKGHDFSIHVKINKRLTFLNIFVNASKHLNFERDVKTVSGPIVVLLYNYSQPSLGMKWNVMPCILQASIFYIFTDLCCSCIAQNFLFAARHRREAKKGY